MQKREGYKVSKYIKFKYCISIITKMAKKIICVYDLYDLYIIQKKSMVDISKLTGYSISYIKTELDKRKIPIRNFSEAKLLLNKRILDDNEVKKMYIEEGLNIYQIAKKLNCSASCVKCSLHRTKVTLNKTTHKSNEKNPQWKGNNVSYKGLHAWIKRHKLKPLFCERCKIKSPRDLANISGEYKRDVNDFEWLCRRCHMKSDGRLKKYAILKRYNNIV
jgi:hypothetical protein